MRRCSRRSEGGAPLALPARKGCSLRGPGFDNCAENEREGRNSLTGLFHAGLITTSGLLRGRAASLSLSVLVKTRASFWSVFREVMGAVYTTRSRNERLVMAEKKTRAVRNKETCTKREKTALEWWEFENKN